MMLSNDLLWKIVYWVGSKDTTPAIRAVRNTTGLLLMDSKAIVDKFSGFENLCDHLRRHTLESILNLVQEGRSVAAIKQLRAEVGVGQCGLKEAHGFVQLLADMRGKSAPDPCEKNAGYVDCDGVLRSMPSASPMLLDALRDLAARQIIREVEREKYLEGWNNRRVDAVPSALQGGAA